MLQNSLFLMASAGLTAGIGFIFWAIVAHLFSTREIGLATTLLSAISLISFLALFGLSGTLVRFPAQAEARDRQVSISLAVVAAASAMIATGYVLCVNEVSPDLAFVGRSTTDSVLLVAICVCAALNLLTDAVFIGARIPEYNTLVDGIIQSLTKVAMPAVLVSVGTMGIVTASGIGYAVAVAASLLFMRKRLGFRFSFRVGGTRLRETVGYSATSYLSALINLLPQLVLPMIVLSRLGPEQSAYFYLATQIAALLSAGSYAIGDALFSEGSHDPDKLGELLKRSAKIMTAVMLPGVAVVIAVRAPLLSIFGAAYSAHAQGLLAALAVGSLAVAFHTWASSALRITGRMRPLLGSNVAFLIATIGLAVTMSGRGLIWVGWAWALGNLASGLFAAAFIPGARLVPRPLPDEAEDFAEVPSGRDVGVEDGSRPGYGSGGSDREPEQGMRRRPSASPRIDRWEGIGDANSVTQPMFLPWNLPEAGRGRNGHGDAGEASSRESGTRGSRPAGPRYYGSQPVRRPRSESGDLRVQPRRDTDGTAEYGGLDADRLESYFLPRTDDRRSDHGPADEETGHGPSD